MIGDSANVSLVPLPVKVEVVPEVESYVNEYINYQSAPLNNLSIGAGKQLSHAKKMITTTTGFKMDVTFHGPIIGRSIGGKIYNGPGKHHDELGRI